MATRVILDATEIEMADLYDRLIPEKREELARIKPSLAKKCERAWVRWRSLNSFYDFTSLCLRNPVLYEPLHRPLCDFVSNWKKKRRKLILLPRGHIKSNCITIGYPIWELILNQNKRMLLSSHKDADSSKFLNTIRLYLDSERFKYYFPEIRPKLSRGRPQQWSDESILIERDGTYTENSIETSSIRQQVTGRHYSGLIGDDWVTPENVGTKNMRTKTSDYRKLAESLLDPGAWEIITGTRYHFEDEYGRIIKENEESNQYDVLHQPAMFDIGIIHEFMSGKRTWTRKEDYKFLLFPTRFTLDAHDHIDYDQENNNRKSLIEVYNKQGPLHFANQYMLEPFDPKKARMHEGMLLEATVLPEGKLDYYRCCDLSSEIDSKHGESYTAIYTLAVTDRCDVYIVDLFWGNFDPHLIVEELIKGQMVPAQVRPKLVTMESGPYDRMLRPFLLRRGRELGVMVPVSQMTGKQHLKNKFEHIDGLIPWLRSGKIHYMVGCRNINILKEEMNKYGAFDRMDCLDALAQIPAMIFPTGSERFLTGHPSSDELEQQAQQFQKQRLEELNRPSIITFGGIKQDLMRNSSMRKRLGGDRIRKVFRND